jgi:hypothetical protein
MANTSSPFLWDSGTTNNGLTASYLTLMTTELNTLATAGVVVSSAGGLSTNGVFNSTLTGRAVFADIFLTVASAVTTVGAGANLTGWFMISPDSGTTYEQVALAPPRNPDFIIPTPVGLLATPFVYKSIGVHKVPVPAMYFKVVVQSNLGVSLPSSGNTLKMAVTSIEY